MTKLMETDHMRIAKLIDACPLFNELSWEEKCALASIGKRELFLKEQYVFTKDQPGGTFYLVESGAFLLNLKGLKTKEYQAKQVFGEVSLFSKGYRLGTIKSKEYSSLIGFDKKDLFDPTQFPAEIGIKVTRILTGIITQYLINREHWATEDLIRKGECEMIEFKASYNLFQIDKMIRTLAAFMNSKGGTILVGVEDDKQVSGVKIEDQEADKLFQNFNRLIRKHLGPYFNSLVTYDLDQINDKTIIRLDCDPSPKPVYYKEKSEETGEIKEVFLVRTGPVNTNLKRFSDVVDYNRKHFG